jgi:hypothetical protein
MYELKYTTLGAIANMFPSLFFEGSIGPADEAFDSYGKQVIPTALVLDVAWQEESEITRIFGQIYELPLRLIIDETKAVLSKISNHQITAELKRRLMEQDPVPSIGSTAGAGSSSNEAIAKNLLLTYTVGHNIIVPGMGPPPQGYGPMQPIFLDGEVPRTVVPDTVVERRMSFGHFTNAPPIVTTTNWLNPVVIAGQELPIAPQGFDVYD